MLFLTWKLEQITGAVLGVTQLHGVGRKKTIGSHKENARGPPPHTFSGKGGPGRSLYLNPDFSLATISKIIIIVGNFM